jgi:hypothetical protein
MRMLGRQSLRSKLRASVTKAADKRCVYVRVSHEGWQHGQTPRQDLLRYAAGISGLR